MFGKTQVYIIFIPLAVALLSCSKYSKIQKSQDYQFKYEKAQEYYDNEDYFRAMNIFDQVMPFFRGKAEAEDIAYKYAYAYYYQKEYILASYNFGRFAQTYPRNTKAEECSFMSAYCKYLESPTYKLDQKNTLEAINELQLFLNQFPNSERLEQCNSLIDELRGKLQKKDFEIAKLYFKMDRYNAAVTAFNNLLIQYPDTKFREDAMYYSIKSYYYYASKSVKSKRQERFQKAIDIYEDFVALFPESKYKRDTQAMIDWAKKDIENL
jgi:outer membrane protein assembly factor BamD